jgi:exodeoxyribonuclease V beta subunit
MIHQVFESIDFSLPDSPAFEKVVDSGLARHGLPRDQAPTLCAGIRQTLATPLGGPLEDFSLGQLAGEDRVDEMEFTLPVSRSGLGPLTAGALADAFEAHASEVWAGEAGTSGYGARIRGLGFAPLQGHLRGFIDLTFRRDGRFYLVDYKSNHLGNHAEHYGQEALRSSMEEHDYVLQYHLYAVALHRHLARRLPGYDFETHMGGAYYLFLRGMSPDAPRGCGIFYDRPSRSLIEALSACLGEPEIASEGSAA